MKPILVLLILLTALLAGLALSPVWAQPGLDAPPAPEVTERALIRMGGDVTVDNAQREDAVVVFGGNATIRGDVRFVAVVGGDAVLDGARVEELVVVDGEAVLLGTTRVDGDVNLIDATLDQEASATILGEVTEDSTYRMGRGLLAFGLLIGLGFSLAVIVWGLLAAAIAPAGMRRAGAAISDEAGRVLVAALLVWFVLPLLAGLLASTVVGLPVGLGILLVLLPALGFLGYLVAGIWLGDVALGALRHRVSAVHPYASAAAGLFLLLVLGWIPFLGALVTVAAVALGSGALALLAWRRFRAPTVADLPATGVSASGSPEVDSPDVGIQDPRALSHV